LRYSIFATAAALLTIIASAAQAGEGQAIYDQHCSACHNRIAPKLGDKAAWAPRIKLGTDALVASVLKGKGIMKPQAGKVTPAQAKAAVEYMVGRSK
jgi:cytochrome c5